MGPERAGLTICRLLTQLHSIDFLFATTKGTKLGRKPYPTTPKDTTLEREPHPATPKEPKRKRRHDPATQKGPTLHHKLHPSMENAKNTSKRLIGPYQKPEN